MAFSPILSSDRHSMNMVTLKLLQRIKVVGRNQRTFTTAKVLRFWLLLCLCAGIAGMAQCARSYKNNGPIRTVHVKVVVEPGFSETPQWRAIITALFEKTNPIMQEHAGVVFSVDTMCVWNMESVPSHYDLFVGDCLVKEQPRGKSDIVVYFTRMSNAPALISGMTLYELGYAYLQEPTTTNPSSIDAKTVYSLVHWLGHMFGAAHCYYNKENVTVMNPFVHDGIIMNPDRSETPGEPDFHEGNVVVMKGLSLRPFEEKDWEKNDWPKIKKVYEKVHSTYNPWKISPAGELTGYEKDAFQEGNLLLYLSSWASLCGYPDRANTYLDSLTVLYEAISHLCVHQGIVGKTRICTLCGYSASEASNWLELQKFYIGMRRAFIQLRKGDTVAANGYFTAAIRNIPDQLEIMKEKYTNGFLFYKERYRTLK
jgi:hypothetical protein